MRKPWNTAPKDGSDIIIGQFILGEWEERRAYWDIPGQCWQVDGMYDGAKFNKTTTPKYWRAAND